MITNKIIRLILSGFFFIGFQAACGQTPVYKKKHNVNTALENLINENTLRNAGIGFYAVDINSGEVIAQHNHKLALAPASTMKLVTSAAALEVFGKNYRFQTRLEYRGYIDTSTHTLNGDLIIRGGGDPTLGSRYFAQNQESFLHTWAKKTAEAGIDSVNGYIIADASLYGYDMVPPTWSWEDMGNYFGAGACGLSVFDNEYTLVMNTGKSIGDTCRVIRMEPEIPGMTFDNTVVADNIRSDLSYIFGQPYALSRYIRGRLPVGKPEYKVKGSMPDPAFYTALRFSETLKDKGIGCRTRPTTYRLNPDLKSLDSLEHTIIYTDYSYPLSYIIQRLNFKSINLVAEHLLNHVAAVEVGSGDTKSGANFIERFWAGKGIDIGGMSLNDGSGLSRYNTVTAEQIAEILKYMKQKGDYETFYASLPTVGKEGTVSYVCRGTSAAGNMRAKSGSIRAVRAYAGYVTSASGREIAFSFMVNNYNGTSSSARKRMEKVMAALADFSL